MMFWEDKGTGSGGIGGQSTRDSPSRKMLELKLLYQTIPPPTCATSSTYGTQRVFNVAGACIDFHISRWRSPQATLHVESTPQWRDIGQPKVGMKTRTA